MSSPTLLLDSCSHNMSMTVFCICGLGTMTLHLYSYWWSMFFFLVSVAHLTFLMLQVSSIVKCARLTSSD